MGSVGLVGLVLAFSAAVFANPSPLTGYDPDYARQMFYMTAGAYAPQPGECVNATSRLTGRQHRLYGAQNTDCDSAGSSCAYFVAVDDALRRIVVVFRGTKGRQQLLHEVIQSMQPNVDFYGHGRVNRYFFRALNTMWDAATVALRDPALAGYSVTFTGHSLGGALASLAAMRVALEQIRPSAQIQLYTFGQPRVGNFKFAADHDQLLPQSYRVVNRYDVVPHLPLCHLQGDEPVDADGDGIPDPDVDPPPEFNLSDAIRKPCEAAHASKAYHHRVEIWYPDGMSEPNARFVECVGEPKNEDRSCSNGEHLDVSWITIQRYVKDHLHYFGQKVSTFGKNGCTDPNDEPIVPVNAAELGSAIVPATTQRPSGFKLAALSLLDRLNRLRHGGERRRR